MIIKEINVQNYVTKSNLPASDYVINPYVGCPHGCKYCYASFMKRFTGHTEEWGSFLDIKRAQKPIDQRKLIGKRIFISSVTDCYNPYEEKYEITKGILKQLIDIDCEITITTKAKLILRDIEILKKMKHLKVALSINTLDEKFRANMDNASSIKERLETLKELHNQGIYTVLFMSPIFPYITEWKEIIEKSTSYIDEYWFENLNLRGPYKKTMMEFIKKEYPHYYSEYYDIYFKNKWFYWQQLSTEIASFCQEKKITYKNFFNHTELVKKKKEIEYSPNI